MTLIVKIDQLKQFHERWSIKAEDYRTDNLADNFDKFFTLFVIYNRIYNVVVAILNQQGGAGGFKKSWKNKKNASL